MGLNHGDDHSDHAGDEPDDDRPSPRGAGPQSAKGMRCGGGVHGASENGTRPLRGEVDAVDLSLRPYERVGNLS